jgi:hypothetical protein
MRGGRLTWLRSWRGLRKMWPRDRCIDVAIMGCEVNGPAKRGGRPRRGPARTRPLFQRTG